MPKRTGNRRDIRDNREPRGEARRPREERDGGRGTRSGRPAGTASYGSSEILKKYLEPDREREAQLEAKKREIMAAKQAKAERLRKQRRELAASRVSYLKKPLAARSRMSLLLAAAAAALGGIGIYEGVASQGQAPLVSGAFGFCSILLSAAAIGYGGLSFLEEDKNYILARCGIAVGGLLLVGWAGVIIIGLRG